MTSLIDRMARAGFEQAMENGRAAGYPGGPYSWDAESEKLKEDWRACARAILMAAREASQEIVEASDMADDVWLGGHLDAYGFTSVWEAGIDKVLTS